MRVKQDTDESTNLMDNSSSSNNPKKPRRSIKAEGARLHSMLKDGIAKVIDPSKLGKRLSSEIWNSFGAIQVEDNFTYPSIVTKTVADGNSTVRICQFFVACSRCFSVFKYDGHAYGTTGLVKHVKNCQANTLKNSYMNSGASSSAINPSHNTSNPGISQNNATNINGTQRKRKAPAAQPLPANIKYLTKIIEETRNEVLELKQKVNDVFSLLSMPTHQVGHIQIISNDGEAVENEMDKPTS